MHLVAGKSPSIGLTKMPDPDRGSILNATEPAIPANPPVSPRFRWIRPVVLFGWERKTGCAHLQVGAIS